MNWPGNVRSNNIKIRSFTFFQILKLICLTFFVSMSIAGAYGVLDFYRAKALVKMGE